MSAAGHGQTVDLGDGHQLREIMAPPHVTGRSLRQLALRERVGVQVLLVRSRKPEGATHLRVPHGDDILVEGDTVIVAGTTDALNKLDALGAQPPPPARRTEE